MITKRVEKYIKHLYLDISSAVSFSSPEKIYAFVKKHGKFHVPLSDIRKVLQKIPTYTLHKKRVDKAKKARAVCPRKDYLCYSDNCYMTKWAEHNKCKFFNLNINCLTREIDATPLVDLTSKSVAQALDKYLKKHKFSYLYSDKGAEYVGKEVQATLRRHKCHHIIASSGQKSFLAEVSIKTVKSRLTRFLFENKTMKWVSVLPKIISNYNRCPQKRLGGLTPLQASKLSNYQLWNLIYERQKTPRLVQRKLKNRPKKVDQNLKFRLGDKVRISKLKKLFSKYSTNYSDEVFEICFADVKSGNEIFRVKDQNQNIITGIFYVNELAKVEDANQFQIENIIKEKVIFGKSFYLVKWKQQEEPTFILASEVDKYERLPSLSGD
mgnify:CR=1 FL=1